MTQTTTLHHPDGLLTHGIEVETADGDAVVTVTLGPADHEEGETQETILVHRALIPALIQALTKLTGDTTQ